MAGLFLAIVLAQAAPPPAAAVAQGRSVYLEHCAACHGPDLHGTTNGPPLRGVGAAAVDFFVSTGRMPATVPWVESGHEGAQFPQPVIDALVAYVASVEAGGAEIPVVATGGDVDRGRELFREDCMHCHGVEAQGGAIGGREWAPPLDRATVTQVAEAIRVGPGEMPTFGAGQVPQSDLDDIVSYLSHERASAPARAVPLTSSGPVPEGLLGWIGAGSMALFAGVFSLGSKNRPR